MDRRTLLGSLVVGAGAAFMPGEASGGAPSEKGAPSVREWDEVLVLGGGVGDLGGGRGRSVPLRRIQIEGVDPTTIYGVNTWGNAEPFRWRTGYAHIGPVPSHAGLRLQYLSSERHWRVSESRTENRTQLHAWWVTAVWGGVVHHADGVSWRGLVSKEGLRFLVGVGGLS